MLAKRSEGSPVCLCLCLCLGQGSTQRVTRQFTHWLWLKLPRHLNATRSQAGYTPCKANSYFSTTLVHLTIVFAYVVHLFNLTTLSLGRILALFPVTTFIPFTRTWNPSLSLSSLSSP